MTNIFEGTSLDDSVEKKIDEMVVNHVMRHVKAAIAESFEGFADQISSVIEEGNMSEECTEALNSLEQIARSHAQNIEANL